MNHQHHDHAIELAATAIDFDLSAAETDELGAHLSTCPTCVRRVAAMRADAQVLRQPFTPLPSPRVDAAVQAAIARRPAQPRRLLLLVAAVLVLVALLGTMAVAASLLPNRETLPTTIVPTPTPTPTVPVVVASPALEASPLPSVVVDALPTPKCPAPQQQVVPPVVSASVGNGQVVAATRGSYTTMTCSTTGTADAAPTSPGESLAAYPGDTITFTVPVGWRFVRWEGSHQPLRGTGGSVWQPLNLLDRPRSIQLPGPLLFDERVSLTVVLVSDDERSVIQIDLQLLVNQAVS
jgi:hypothetical protein